MTRQEVLEILARQEDELRQYGAKSLVLFGSLSCGEATAGSDIDLLVEFSRPVGMLAFIRLQHRLAEILGGRVDLVTPAALNSGAAGDGGGRARVAMNNFEVPEPIINSPYEEPSAYWYLEEGQPPEKRPGRREAGYHYRDPRAPTGEGEHEARGIWVPLAMVNCGLNIKRSVAAARP